MNFTRLDIVDTKAFAVKKSRRLRGTGQERGAKDAYRRFRVLSRSKDDDFTLEELYQ